MTAKRPLTKITAIAVVCVAAWAGLSGAAGATEAKNDYPTAARADYVFACMAANGQTRQALEKCSCSIDVIASVIPHERYVQAETILRMQLVGGEKSELFRGPAWMKQTVDDLRRAQAEAEIRCF
jgi:hypothetical protein